MADHRADFAYGAHDEIYTNGAFCRAERVTKNGREMWQWVVLQFIDESFLDGESIDPVELAISRKGLYGKMEKGAYPRLKNRRRKRSKKPDVVIAAR